MTHQSVKADFSQSKREVLPFVAFDIEHVCVEWGGENLQFDFLVYTKFEQVAKRDTLDVARHPGQTHDLSCEWFLAVFSGQAC